MNKKIIAIIFIFFISLISLFIAKPVYGASGVIRNLGNVTYNGSKVGHFEMNEQLIDFSNCEINKFLYFNGANRKKNSNNI